MKIPNNLDEISKKVIYYLCKDSSHNMELLRHLQRILRIAKTFSFYNRKKDKTDKERETDFVKITKI